MRFIQNFKFKAHILYIDNLFNQQAYEIIIFLMHCATNTALA